MDARPGRYLASLLVMLGVAVGIPVAAALLKEARPPAARIEPRSVSAGRLAASSPLIARRVEALRRLRFEQLPRPRLITVASLRHLFLADLRRPRAQRQLQADREVLTLLGLLEPSDDVQQILGETAAGVAGAYDSRSKRLLIIRETGNTGAAFAEVTLSHELTHALEDQRFGLPKAQRLLDDRALATTALVEGSATSVMVDYAARFLDLGDLFELANPELTDEQSLRGVPQILRAQLFFSYLRGLTFVAELRRLGRDWDLVDIAERSRPPLSTEQIMHPAKYLTYEAPLPIRIDAGARLGSGWRRVASGSLGEFDTAQLLGPTAGPAQAHRAAAGWGGGRFELWRHGLPGRPACGVPCRSRDVLVVAWRWDTRRDASQFSRLLPVYIGGTFPAEPLASNLWAVDGGGVARIAARRRSVTLVFAPSKLLARQAAG